jgi:hypothetical protein
MGGGSQPVWFPDGRELAYWGSTDLTVVRFTADSAFETEPPVPMIRHNRFVYYDGRNFDIDSKGERFLMVRNTNDYEVPYDRIIVVQNWLDSVTQRIATN